MDDTIGTVPDPAHFVVHLPPPKRICAKQEAIQQVASMRRSLFEILQQDIEAYQRKLQLMTALGDKQIELERGYCRHKAQYQ